MGKKSRAKKLRRAGVDPVVAKTIFKTLDETTLREIVKKSSAKHAEQDARILAILNAVDTENIDVNGDTLEIYLDFLKQNIENPCIVTGMQDFRWEGYYVFGPGSKKEYEKLKKDNPSYTDTFEILTLYNEPDDSMGIFARVRRISDRKKFDLPLADLKAADPESKNAQMLDDYSCWFVNNR